MPGFGQQNMYGGMSYPPPNYPPPNYPPPNFPPYQQFYPHAGAPPAFNSPRDHSTSRAPPIPQHPQPPTRPPSYPSIQKWLEYCDKLDERRLHSNTPYTSFSDLFSLQGLRRLEQLEAKYLDAGQLRDWLKIDIGCSLDIIRYANEDLEAIRSGRSLEIH